MEWNGINGMSILTKITESYNSICWYKIDRIISTKKLAIKMIINNSQTKNVLVLRGYFCLDCNFI